LPPHLQKKAIVWGTVGAIAVRSLMTLGVVWLLKIPGLMLLGGLGLLWIAGKLIVDTGKDEDHGPAASSFWGAMKTIIVADALMGVDNVLGVAGAAHGAWDLVIIGLLVSVPIVVFGSSVVLRLVERFPVIIQLGAAVLAWTAAKMILGEPWLDAVFDAPEQAWRGWLLQVLAVAGVLLVGHWLSRRTHTAAAAST
jgi:YjbE family integral membrane protein